MARAEGIQLLEALALKIASVGIHVSRRGGDYAPFLFAEGNGRAIEISNDGYGLRWDLEIWDRGNDPEAPGRELVVHSEKEVLQNVLDWLRV